MRTVTRYLSIYAALWKNSVTREMIFKSNFLLWIIVELLWFGLQLSFIGVLYLHTDHIGGVPAIVNAVFGKQWAPNQVQPRWILEGLAVYEETLHTSGGRLRSSIWDM